MSRYNLVRNDDKKLYYPFCAIKNQLHNIRQITLYSVRIEILVFAEYKLDSMSREVFQGHQRTIKVE